MRNRWTVFTWLLAVTLLPAFLSGQARPKVTLNPTLSPPKSPVLASGKNFLPGAHIIASLDTQQIGEALADASGAFKNARINIPSGIPEGRHTMAFVDISNPQNYTVLIPFTIQTNWSQRRFDSWNDANNPYEWKLDSSTVTALAEAWSTTVVPCPPPGGYNPKGFGTTAIIAAGIVYYNSATGGLQALDAATGTLLWTYDMTTSLGGNCGTSPTASVSPTGKGLVFVTNEQGRVYALDVSTHKVVWNYDGGLGASQHHPVAYGNTIYIVNGAGDAVALNRLNGALQWSRHLDGCYAEPVAVRNGVMYFTTDNCGIQKLSSSNGQILASNSGLGGCFGVFPVASAKLAYTGGCGDPTYPIFGLNSAKLNLALQTPNEGDPTQLALDGGQIYSVRALTSWVTNTADLCASDATNGTPVWCLTPPGSVPFAGGEEVVANGIVYVGAVNDLIQAVIAVDRNGNILVQKILAGPSLDGQEPIPSAVVDGTLYVESFASTTGEPARLWAFR